MKHLTITLITFFLAYCIQANAEDSDKPLELADILLKYTEAQGGIEEINKIQSIRMKGVIEMADTQIPFSQTKKQPDLIRIHLEYDNYDILWGYNGEVAWQKVSILDKATTLDPQLADSFLRDSRLFSHLVYAAQDKGKNVEYLGEVKLEKTPSYKLRVTAKNGDLIDYYLNSDTFLEIKIETITPDLPDTISTTTYFHDYRAIGELQIPHLIRTFKGEELESEMNLENIRVNVGIYNNYFEPPTELEQS